MAAILQFHEQPRRTFLLQVSVEMQPPEKVTIVYELPAGPVTFSQAPIPSGFTRSPDGLRLSGGETLTSTQPTFGHDFDLDNTGGIALISVKAAVTWPAGSFDAHFTRVQP